jgi:hypothetical protein
MPDVNAIFPVHAINSYLWKRITDEGILTTIPYNGIEIRPIVPVQQLPVLAEAIDAMPGVHSYPFLVYNWTQINTGDMWFVKTHEIAYSLRSDDDNKTSLLIDLINKEFEKYDESAKPVNDYIASIDPPARFAKFHFKYISVSTLGGQLPTTEQNGPSEAIIILRAAFTEDES